MKEKTPTNKITRTIFDRIFGFIIFALAGTCLGFSVGLDNIPLAITGVVLWLTGLLFVTWTGTEN